MPATAMFHAEDPKTALLKKIGPVDDIEVLHNEVLVAVYIAPEKTKGGVIRPTSNVDEDRYQSKVGLILKVGPSAFEQAEGWSWPDGIGVGDWVYFRVSDGFNMTVNGSRDNLCRQLGDNRIRGRIADPDQVW